MRGKDLLKWGWLLLFVGIVSCGPKKNALFFSPGKTLAVVPIECPSLPSEVITGYLLNGQASVPQRTLKKLNSFLLKELVSHCPLKIISPHLIRQCKEILLKREQDFFSDPIAFWSKVGRCIPSDYILVPQILKFRERQGGDWGVFVPAKVVIAMNLINTDRGVLISSYIFQEEQVPLMENLLEIKKFFRRGGKWVTAFELAREGIIDCLRHLHLYVKDTKNGDVP